MVDSTTRQPLKGVQVSVSPGGYSAAGTDSLGRYIIANIPFGTYAEAAAGNFQSNTRTGIAVIANDTTHVDTLFAANLLVFPKDVSGALIGNTDSAKIERIVVTIKGDPIDAVHPLLQQLTWLATSKRYSGNVFLPSAGAKWTAEVRVSIRPTG